MNKIKHTSFFSDNSRISPRAFTLVELLVAMVVLSILVVLLAQMLGMASSMWKLGTAQADNFTQARVVLGMIDRDIQSMVIRSDLAAFVDDQGTSVPSCAFYTRFPTTSGNRNLSLVQYKIANSGNGHQLFRYDSVLGFSFPSATSPTTTTIPFGTLTNLSGLFGANSQPLVDGVVEFSIQFLGSDGNVYANYSPSYINEPIHGMASVPSRAAILSIMVLDSASYNLATNSNAMNALTSSVAGIPNTGETYAQFWNAIISTPGYGVSWPQSIRGGIHVFERRISIPVPGAQ